MSLKDAAYQLSPSVWASECLNFQPDAWQIEVLDSNAPRILLNCSRQSGKSSVSAILALHTAIYTPSSLVLLVSHSLRQSRELMIKFMSYMEMLDVKPAKSEDTKLSIQLSNGSRVVSLPDSEGTIRGYSAANLLIIDEAARVLDPLYYALKPMLAVSRGRLLALSTPFGKRGWWFEEYQHKEERGWEYHEITAHQCSRIPASFLEAERQSMPRAIFEAEYMCAFNQTTDSCFDYDDVQSALAGSVEELVI